MRRLLQLAIALIALTIPAWAQTGNTITIYFPGAPSGSCSYIMYAINVASGGLYDCPNGSWNLVGGGGSSGGTVTSVLGTANQINSDGSTTTPTLSLSSTLVAPGSIAATTTLSSGAVSGTAGQLRLLGTTSGTGTLTVDATAANITSGSNFVVPTGAGGSPGLISRTGTTIGIGSGGTGSLILNTASATSTVDIYAASTNYFTFSLSSGSVTLRAQPSNTSLLLQGNHTAGANSNIVLTQTAAFTSATAVNSFHVDSRGSFAPTSASAGFVGLMSNPTINQTGGANGTIRVVAAYPINTSLGGAEYLFAGGTSSGAGPTGTLTDKFLVDNSGNLTTYGSLATADSGVFGSKQTQATAACETSFAATTLATGATTTDTGLNCLPANSVIDAVVYRITTTITTAANFTIGDATIAARFCGTQSTLTAGTTGICFLQEDQTGTSGPRQTSAAAVRVTTNANPGAGAIRLIVYYHTWTAPTS